MNIKRSYFKLLMGSATVGLFLANCTVKNSSSDECEKGDKDSGCECPGSVTGYQVCDSQGVFGDCMCPDGSSHSTAGSSNSSTAGSSNSSTGGTESGSEGGASSTTTGGKTYTAGTGNGGVAAATATDGGATGEGGEGGAPLTFDPEDCESCLAVLCDDELTACLADEMCFAQYSAISQCIDDERVNGLVKRDIVRGCGVNVSNCFGNPISCTTSPTADINDLWAPTGMVPEATNLINCLASTSSEEPNADWANDQATNFPAGVPAPWPEDSCAKLSCTSKFQ